MSDSVQIALITGLTTSLPSIIAAYFAYRSAHDSRQTKINTNHMKDELVAAVSKERFAAGAKSETDKINDKE